MGSKTTVKSHACIILEWGVRGTCFDPKCLEVDGAVRVITGSAGAPHPAPSSRKASTIS